MVSQDPFLFSATVRENIAFGRPDATDEEVERGRAAAQAHEFIERLPEGYETVIGERGITLSGGQRQRIAIARALVDRPADPRSSTTRPRRSTRRPRRGSALGLREAMKGRTTIIIAHRLSTIALADEVVVLEHGRVAARGTHDRAARGERGLPRDPRARPARAASRVEREGRVKVWQRRRPSLTAERGAGDVGDWSWRRHAAPVALLGRLAPPVPAAHGARARDRCSSATARLARAAATSRSSRSTTASARAIFTTLAWIVGALPRRRRRRRSCSRGADLLHRLDGERMLADLRNHAVPPPPAALARLLRAEPAGRDRQPHHERRRGARPARHRRRHEPRPELAALVGTAVILFLLDWRLALATLVVVPPMAVGTASSAVRSTAPTAACASGSALVTATLAEDIAGMRVVQSFTREPRASARVPRA